MRVERFSMWFVTAILLATLPHAACEDWECGYGGPGCSEPIMAGLCEDTLVLGQEYVVIFGYGSDTGVSEATVTGVFSNMPEIMQVIPTPGTPDVPYETGPTGPFDLNNGPGDGGMTLRPVTAGKALVTITLEGWEEKIMRSFEVVDAANAPHGFMPMSATERLAKCIEMTTK